MMPRGPGSTTQEGSSPVTAHEQMYVICVDGACNHHIQTPFPQDLLNRFPIIPAREDLLSVEFVKLRGLFPVIPDEPRQEDKI